MEDLDERLAQVGAILVEDRVLRRLIKRHRRIAGIGLQVPHATSYALPKARLLELVEPDELAADPDKLPERVVVFTGSRDALAAETPDALSRAWRAIFHARIHDVFDARFARRELTHAAIRERINRIGQTEFDEIRFVLRQADLLLPPHDDANTYAEFVAVYLELSRFAPRNVAQTFPALADIRRVDATIAQDIDAEAVLAASRPPGAPERPIADAPPAADDPAQRPQAIAPDPSAAHAAARVRAKGNRARAAILSVRAGDRDAARADIAELAARLARAVAGDGRQAAWVDALMPVAEVAASQRVLRFTPGARLLHDLQSACVVAEREVKVVDVATWLLSLGEQPIVRALPATREVRVAKHLRAAAAKIASVRVGSAADRERLAGCVHELVERAETNVRTTLRPKLEAALDGVGFRPGNLPERVAQNKLIEELLDHAVGVGRLTIGNLRDVLSKNDLKMDDLRAAELVRGDQLLRADKILSRSLDGVYRRAEGYLRFLQKLSSVLFGTVVGRFLTLYLLLPALGAYVPLTGLQHIIGPLSKILWGVEPEIATNERYVGLAIFLFLLLHVAPFRAGVAGTLRAFARGLRLVLFDAPRALWRLPIVQRVMASRAGRWVIKPAIPAAIVFVVIRGRFGWPIAAGVFVAFEVIMNSRFGRVFEEVVADWLVRLGRHFARQIIPGLIKYLLQAFADTVEMLDRGIYRIDEWLRFKAGQSTVTLVIKGVLGALWGLISYVLRIYVNLFIEPSVNPVKHFPVVTVAAKILWPFSGTIIHGVRAPLVGLVGFAVASSFGAFTALVLPGFAGFLVWEFKENWKLYRATRPRTLKEIAIGHHGESMVAFLKLGFHSGTIPKAYAKLRRAAWKGDERAVAKHREALHHVEEAIWKLADRELISILNEAKSFCADDVRVTRVELGSNRVEIEIAAPSVASEPLAIVVDEQSGWLLARIARAGWITALADAQRRIFETALAGFYKLAGVDVVREQLEHALGADGGASPAYDISAEGLVVWPGRGYQTELVYDLRSRELAPVVRGAFTGQPPRLTGDDVLFGRQPIAWSLWAATWERIAAGEDPPPIVAGPSLLPERSPRRAQAAV